MILDIIIIIDIINVFVVYVDLGVHVCVRGVHKCIVCAYGGQRTFFVLPQEVLPCGWFVCFLRQGVLLA